MRHDQTTAIETALKMAKHNTLRGLMRDMNEKLVNYFGFEAINIMFVDPDKKELYTITYGDDEARKELLNFRLERALTEKHKQDLLDIDGI